MARKPTPRKPGGDGPPRGGVPEHIKVEIVSRLACYDRICDIQADLRERGIEISDRGIAFYNAETCQRSPKKWRDLFFQARESFLTELAKEPVTHRAFRVRRLGMLHERALLANEREEAAKYLEQAAKEVGGFYTNISKVQGAVLHDHRHRVEDMTSDEKRNMLADRLAEAAAKLRSAPDAHPQTKH